MRINRAPKGRFNTRHTSSLQLHPHTHHIVIPGFVDRPRRSDYTAGQMDGEAGWWTTIENIGLPPLARVMGVGRQQQFMRIPICFVDKCQSQGFSIARDILKEIYNCR